MPVTIKANATGQASPVKCKKVLLNNTTPTVLYIKQRRNSVLVRNYSDVTIFVGDKESLLAGEGFPILKSELIAIDLRDMVEIFAIAESGSGKDVRILEV